MCGKFLWVLEDDVGIFVAKFGAFAIHWSTLMHICHPLMHTPIQTAKKFKSIDLKSIIAVSVDSKSCSIWILWNASGFAVPIPNVLLEMFTNQTDLISQRLPLPMQGLMKPFPVSESFFLSTTQSLERFYLGPNVSSLFPIRSPLKHHNHPCVRLWAFSVVSGTCLTSSECSTAGGSSDGNCAAGFGVCCEFYRLVFL